MDWLIQYGGTIGIALILAVWIAFVAARMVRAGKRGKSGCGCGCSHCPSAGLCQGSGEKEKAGLGRVPAKRR